ncbi:MAG: DUF1844 domain-containing protein [Deltaproteobacteria bacterium]|nr:DUF1844 domain-containing protein [Deltaproteobacteria bacterium]
MAEDNKGFVIKDRRSFGSEAEKPSSETPEESREQKESEVKEEAAKTEEKTASSEEVQLPEVNFSTFIFSLSSSAFLHLGEIEDPSTGTKQKNLPMAKHTIDILGMLKEKTEGNLTEDETQLLTNILYDLRMRYVKDKS